LAYIGQNSLPFDPFRSAAPVSDADRFSGNASTTTFTLSRAVSFPTDIEVFVENVQQEPIVSYSVSGASLTFTEAPPTGTNNVYVVYRNYQTGAQITLPDGSVTYNKLANNIRLFTTDNFTSNGTVSTFSLSEQPADANTVLVTVDGIVQRATEHYGLTGKTITFTSTPASNSLISIRHLGFRTTTTVTAIPPGTNISNPVITNGMTVTGDVTVSGNVTMNLLNFTHIASNDVATFTDMQAVVANCTTASGNTSVTYRSNTAAITVGMFVTGATINVGSVVTSVVNANTITISSAAANSSTNTALTFYTPNKLLVSHVASPGVCKAWVNFNGFATTTATLIRGAFNVSSIQDDGTGIYTVNFTTAMPDVNYCVNASSSTASISPKIRVMEGYTTTSVTVRTSGGDTSAQSDAASVFVSIFR
jgi:hypothetical protein